MSETILGAPAEPAATGNTAADAGGGQSAAGAASAPWFADFKNPDVKTWAEKLNLPNAEMAAQKAYNLEKLLGADKAGRGVVLPKEGDAKAQEEFYSKLGKPAKVEDYKIEMPDGSDTEQLKAALPLFHKHNLTQSQASGLAKEWTEMQMAKQQAEVEKAQQQATLDHETLKKEWGAEYNTRVQMANAAMRAAGITPEEGLKLEMALGVGRAAKIMSELGKSHMEAPVHRSDDAATKFGITPEEARGKITALKGDKAWTQRYIDGDTSAREEFNRLHQIAYST
jgi:hypothetical protein